MITLGTGLPGNGKTLFMLWYLKDKADRENREVYYYGVKGLNTEVLTRWKPFEPEKWYELPPGCLVIIDEAQDFFGRKAPGATLPKHYTELNTHRHLGIDIYLITQHPSLLDNAVRRLVGQHFHSIRKFGLERSTIYEWSACSIAPENVAQQKLAISLKWKFPKEVYTWYKSAEVHTVKKAIPAKLILVLVMIVALAAYALWAFTSFGRKVVTDSEPVDAQSASVAAPASALGLVPVSGSLVAAAKYRDPVEDAKEYMFNQTPRVESLPETAPKYDPLTVPVRVPVPAMCVQIGSVASGKEIRCKCYTQQATPLDIEFNMCISIARNGRFMDFDPEPMRRQEQTAQRSAQTLQAQPDVPLRQNYGAPQVIAFNDVPDASMPGPRPSTDTDTGPPNRPNTRSALARE